MSTHQYFNKASIIVYKFSRVNVRGLEIAFKILYRIIYEPRNGFMNKEEDFLSVDFTYFNKNKFAVFITCNINFVANCFVFEE